MIRKCLYCGEEFEAKVQQAKFCNNKCHDKWHWDNKPLIKKQCKRCGKEFETKNKKTIFCSLKCSSNYNIDKVQQTCLNKYGAKAPLELKEFLSKKNKTCLNKYGTENVAQLQYFKDKTKQTCLERYGVEYATQTDDFKSRQKQTLLKNHGVPYGFMLGDYSSYSGYNKQLGEWLQSITGEEVTYEFQLGNYRYDIKYGKFLFEVDPIWTHNSSKRFFKGKDPLPKLYHQKKSLFAESQGYHCIHLFNRDNNETVKEWIKGLITKRKRLYHGEIRKVNGKDAEVFYSENHLQGKCSATVHYGLYVKDKLINCMSFTCFKGEWQLVRFASLKGYRIAHGAEKLFNAFVKEYDPDYIVSFSDITKHSGGLYNALGFKLEKINAPSYWRVDIRGKHLYWRRDCQKQNMYRLEGFDPNYKYLEHKDDKFWKQTEAELMESHGYVRVYDSGMRKHVRYKKDQS